MSFDPSPAIEVRDLTLEAGGRVLFSGRDFVLNAGEKALITGPSGCGKSTFLASLLGFMPARAGEIRLFGELLGADTVWTLRRRLAHVPQETRMAEPTVRAWFDAIFRFRANAEFTPSPETLRDALVQFRLEPDTLNKAPSALSGGERQRVAIIAALLLKRPLLLLDEPTSALDEKSRHLVWDALDRQATTAVLAITHDPQIAQARGWRVERFDAAVPEEATHGA